MAAQVSRREFFQLLSLSGERTVATVSQNFSDWVREYLQGVELPALIVIPDVGDEIGWELVPEFMTRVNGLLQSDAIRGELVRYHDRLAFSFCRIETAAS